MPQGGLCREALGISALNGVRYGHSHCKQKAGEYNIRQSHKVFTINGMFQPMGYVMHFPEVIDENHGEHGQRPQHVNGRIAP